jgi:hypothetical protein
LDEKINNNEILNNLNSILYDDIKNNDTLKKEANELKSEYEEISLKECGLKQRCEKENKNYETEIKRIVAEKLNLELISRSKTTETMDLSEKTITLNVKNSKLTNQSEENKSKIKELESKLKNLTITDTNLRKKMLEILNQFNESSI